MAQTATDTFTSLNKSDNIPLDATEPLLQSRSPSMRSDDDGLSPVGAKLLVARQMKRQKRHADRSMSSAPDGGITQRPKSLPLTLDPRYPSSAAIPCLDDADQIEMTGREIDDQIEMAEREIVEQTEMTEREVDEERNSNSVRTSRTRNLPRTKSEPRSPAIDRVRQTQVRHSPSNKVSSVAVPDASHSGGVPATWISKAEFDALPAGMQLSISALAAADTLMTTAAEKFGDQWRWSDQDAPMRAVAQRGRVQEKPNEYLGSVDEFKAAVNTGTLPAYMANAVKGASTVTPTLVQQADQAFVHGLAKLEAELARHCKAKSSKERIAVFNALCNINAPSSVAAIKAYFPAEVIPGILAFQRGLNNLFQSVASRARAGYESVLTATNIAKTFYVLIPALLSTTWEQLSADMLNIANTPANQPAIAKKTMRIATIAQAIVQSWITGSGAPFLS